MVTKEPGRGVPGEDGAQRGAHGEDRIQSGVPGEDGAQEGTRAGPARG